MKLLPYQKESVEWIKTKRFALLAHEMGLGKTAVAIQGLDSVLAKRVIVVVPSVAKINWLREFELWSSFYREFKVCHALTDTPAPHQSVICSYEYATRNAKFLTENRWDALICDESHLLKEHTSKRSQAILGRKGIFGAADRCWLISGTPAPNNPSEVWILLFISGQTKMGFNEFVERFCLTRPTSYGLKILGANRDRIPELQQLLKPIMIRKLKKDVMTELPPITYVRLMVEPGVVEFEKIPSFAEYFVPVPQRRKLIKEIERQEKLLLNVWTHTKREGGRNLQAIESIAESVSTLRKYLGLQKVQPTIDIVSHSLRHYKKDKLVIFAIHRDVIEGIREGLREFKPVTLYGGTDPKRRQRNIDKFQNNPRCRVFIGNIHAAGVAINLTAAHNILFVEQDWVPGNNAQAVMRCHRIGQKNKVVVKFMGIDGSLDSRIAMTLKKKTEDLTAIFDR